MSTERAAQPKEWALIVENPRFFQKPDTLTTADDAFTLLGHILWRWKEPRRFHRPGETMPLPQEAQPEIDQMDQEVALFVAGHPGALETLLQKEEAQEHLAFSQSGEDAQQRREGRISGGLPKSLLSVFLGDMALETGELLWRTANALDPLTLNQLAAGSPERWREFLTIWNTRMPFGRLIRSLLGRVGVAGFPTVRLALTDVLAPSVLDAMEAMARLPANQIPHFHFPDILPDEAQLVAMHPKVITQTLADYLRVTPEAFSARLVRSKFLAEGESVGALIWRDAKMLLELGVSRKVLAKALSDVMLLETRMLRIITNPDEPMMMGADVDVANWVTRAQATWDVQWDASAGFWQGGPPLGVEVISYMGHHHDPFHTADTYYLSPEVKNDRDCAVRNENTGEVLFYSGMAPYLLRRACFFEGSVRYRLDPAKACRVLAPLLGA